MKKGIIVLSLICSAMQMLGQDKKGCKADALAEKPGVVIQREYVNISKLKNLSIVVEYVTDLSNNQKLSAVDMEYDITASGEEKGSSVSTLLDPDEADGLIAFIQNLQDNIIKAAAPKNYTEYSYQTLSGFEAGCYWNNAWKIYIKIDVSDDKTTMELDKDDLTAFVSFIKQAKAKL
jgi:hypothetical protein